MPNPENNTKRTVRTLTFKEEASLKNQTRDFGQQCADAGIPTVTINMERLVNIATSRRHRTFVPAEFLTSASTRLWQKGAEPKDIYTLYTKWFQKDAGNTETMEESDIISEIQSSFVYLAGKFTTAEVDPKRKKETLANSVDFIDKNSANQQDKVESLMYYAKYLFENDMENEGRKIAETVGKLAPKTIDSLLDLKIILQQLSRE